MKHCITLAVVASLTACSVKDEAATATWISGDKVIRGTAPLAYITNNGEDTLSVISIAEMREIERHPVGVDVIEREAPHHVVADPEGGYVFVGLSNVFANGSLSTVHGEHGGGVLDSYVQRLDIATLAPSAFVRVPSNLGEITFSASLRKVVTTHFNLARAQNTLGPTESKWAELTVVDADTMTRKEPLLIGLAPHGAALVNDGHRVIAASYGDDQVVTVDLAADGTPSLVSRTNVGSLAQVDGPPHYGPYAVSVHPDGQRVFIGTTGTRDVRVFDASTQQMIPTAIMDVGGAAFFGAFSEDGSRYYVPSQNLDAVSIIDTSSYAVISSKQMVQSECTAPHIITRVANDAHLYLVCEGNHQGPGSLLQLDAETLETTMTLPLGVYPDAIAIVTEVTW